MSALFVACNEAGGGNSYGGTGSILDAVADFLFGTVFFLHLLIQTVKDIDEDNFVFKNKTKVFRLE